MATFKDIREEFEQQLRTTLLQPPYKNVFMHNIETDTEFPVIYVQIISRHVVEKRRLVNNIGYVWEFKYEIYTLHQGLEDVRKDAYGFTDTVFDNLDTQLKHSNLFNKTVCDAEITRVEYGEMTIGSTQETIITYGGKIVLLVKLTISQT